MPKQHNSEIRLKCASCKDFTQTLGPIIITKLTNNRCHIKKLYVQFIINLDLHFKKRTNKAFP